MKRKTTIALICFLALNLHAQTLIKDLNPGKSGSNPFIVERLNGGFIFIANTPSTGNEFWFSDGTDAGTILLKDINPGPGSGTTTTTPVILNGHLYFVARTSGFMWSLWKTDGTTNGTVMVKDLGNMPISNPNGQLYLCVLKNNILFGYDDQSMGLGAELWISDGTTSGTKLLKDINSFGSSNPSGLTAYGNYVYFFANTSDYGNELWRSNGTDTGTVLFKDIKPGIESAFSLGLPSFLVFKNQLYFGANGNDSAGVELWRTDGTKNNTKQFININTTLGGSSFPGLLLANENFLFFRASNGIDGTEPWISDGTLAGTKQLMDINPGSNSSTPSSPILINNKIIFNASSLNEGSEAYVTDGTSAGTSILKDIIPGNGSSYPLSKILHKNKVYFYAVDSTYGSEIWQTDGTSNGTSIALDINPGKKGSNARNLYSFNNELYFSATVDKDSLGQELYKYNFKTSIKSNQVSIITVYPNPLKSGSAIQIDGTGNAYNLIRLIDCQGKILISANSTLEFINKFNNSVIPTGVYNIHLSDDAASYNVKIIVEQ